MRFEVRSDQHFFTFDPRDANNSLQGVLFKIKLSLRTRASAHKTINGSTYNEIMIKYN